MDAALRALEDSNDHQVEPAAAPNADSNDSALSTPKDDAAQLLAPADLSTAGSGGPPATASTWATDECD